LVVLLALAGCAGKAGFASRAASAADAMPGAPAQAVAPPPLDRSLFARNLDGTLSEDALQTILEAPLELDLPARVGVLPVVSARDFRGPSPAYEVPAGVSAFARTLRGSEHFTLVTEVLPIPSGALGMEALRETAARYRLRYVILYREQYARRERSNGWAAGYATVVGALFLPGLTLSVDGFLEASLFDVKTGLLLCTVRRAVSARKETNLWHRADKFAGLERTLGSRFAPELAKDVWNQVTELARAQVIEDERRAARGKPHPKAALVVEGDAAPGDAEAEAPAAPL
jgi:hypothetical protein